MVPKPAYEEEKIPPPKRSSTTAKTSTAETKIRNPIPMRVVQETKLAPTPKPSPRQEAQTLRPFVGLSGNTVQNKYGRILYVFGFSQGPGRRVRKKTEIIKLATERESNGQDNLVDENATQTEKKTENADNTTMERDSGYHRPKGSCTAGERGKKKTTLQKKEKKR